MSVGNNIVNAEEFGNDASIEALWAIKAYEHAQIYFNLISSVDPKILKLTRHDDELYTAFKSAFPSFKLDVLNIDELKSEEAKAEWRVFCEEHKDLVEDFNYGTLIRIDSHVDYVEENSLLVTRIQFYAIEIARNMEGHNDKIRELFKPTPSAKEVQLS